jgi:3-oxoacyl-[acyl-carrier protein] reductase
MNKPLNDQIVLVTGSSRGIGKAIANRFANAGATIIVNSSKSVDEAQKTLSDLPAPRNEKNHSFIQADMGEPSQILKLVKSIEERYGRLDILINNAATTTFIKHNDLDKLSIDVSDQIYKTNFRGPLLLIRQALPLLKKGSHPQIINIVSTAATTAMGSNVVYCAMKAALLNLTYSLARALAPDIRVNAVSPGLIKTELTKAWKEYHEAHLVKTPLQRLGTEQDIAEAAISLANSLPFVTGHNLVVDGGKILSD